MVSELQNVVALLHIHKDISVDFDQMLQVFNDNCRTALAFNSLQPMRGHNRETNK